MRSDLFTHKIQQWSNFELFKSIKDIKISHLNTHQYILTNVINNVFYVLVKIDSEYEKYLT